MKKFLKSIVALVLSSGLALGATAPGDIRMSQRNAQNTNFADIVFATGNNTLFGGNATGVPSLVTLGSGISLSAGVLTVTANGTGNITGASMTANAVVLGNGTNSIKVLASLGTAGQALLSNGASAAPSFGSITVAAGGTGVGTLTANAVILGNGTGAVTTVSPGTAGEVLTSNGSAWISSPATGGVTVSGTPTSGQIAEWTSATNVQGKAVIGSGNVVLDTSPSFTTNLTLATSAAPSTGAAGALAFDTNAWAGSRGAAQLFDGTANTNIVATLASDTPSNGQVPTWNTGGTITWETVSGTGDALTSNPLSQFAATTSAQLRGVLTDENGTGAFLTDNGSGASLTALNATQLTSGTVPDGRFPATLPAASGVNLTALNGTNIASGTVADARIDAAITRDAELDTVAERTALGIKSTTAGSPEEIQDHGSMGATETFDLTTANVHRGELDANLTLTLSGFTSGKYCSGLASFTQDATGSRTVTWPGAVVTAPTINPAAQSITFVAYWSWDGGTTIYAQSDYVPDSGVTAATYGSATAAPQIAVNAKGVITSASNVTVTPAVGSITGFGTGVATALAVNVGSAGAFVTFNGALGTPSSGTLTNATGLPISTGVSGLGTDVATSLGTAINTGAGFVTTTFLSTVTGTIISDTAYNAGTWDAVTDIAPSKNAVRDKFESLAQANIAGLTTADSPQLAGVNIGDASDTTLTRASAGNIAVEGNAIFRVGGSFVGLPDIWVIAISDEATAITTGTAKVTFRAPYAATVTAVRASLTTVSSSGTPTFDINEGGTTILSTKLTIDASEKTSTTAAAAAVISDSALADDAEITIDVDTAGTGAAGAKVVIYVTRA